MVINGDTQSWQDLWPRLAERFCCTNPSAMFSSDGAGGDVFPGFASTVMKLHERPPVKEVEGKMGSEDEFGQSEVHCQIDLQKWAKRPDVVKAWERLRDRHGLDQGA